MKRQRELRDKFWATRKRGKLNLFPPLYRLPFVFIVLRDTTFICTLTTSSPRFITSSPTFSVRPCSSVGRVTVDLIRRSRVRLPPRSKDFFVTSCGSLIPFTRANAEWVINGFYQHLNLHFRVNSLFHHLKKGKVLN